MLQLSHELCSDDIGVLSILGDNEVDTAAAGSTLPTSATTAERRGEAVRPDDLVPGPLARAPPDPNRGRRPGTTREPTHHDRWQSGSPTGRQGWGTIHSRAVRLGNLDDGGQGDDPVPSTQALGAAGLHLPDDGRQEVVQLDVLVLDGDRRGPGHRLGLNHGGHGLGHELRLGLYNNLDRFGHDLDLLDRGRHLAPLPVLHRCIPGHIHQQDDANDVVLLRGANPCPRPGANPSLGD